MKIFVPMSRQFFMFLFGLKVNSTRSSYLANHIIITVTIFSLFAALSQLIAILES